MEDVAAQLAERLRAGKKAHALSGAAIAEQIEQLTGSRPSLMWVSRRLHGSVPIVRSLHQCSHCDLVAAEYTDVNAEALARVLGVDLTGITAPAGVRP